jgi:hypothetical protein
MTCAQWNFDGNDNGPGGLNPSKLPRVSQQFQLIFSRDDRCPSERCDLPCLFRVSGPRRRLQTINGKVYKDATIRRVEADGIVLRTKTGISKIYFIELPKDVQERFDYTPPMAVTAPPEREPIKSRQATGLFGDVVKAKLSLAPNVADLIGSLPHGPGRKTELPASAAVPAAGVAAGSTAVAVIAEHTLAISVRENADGPAAGAELANATSNAAFTIPMNTTEFSENVLSLDKSGISSLKHLHFGGDTAVSHLPPTGDAAVSHVPVEGGTAVSRVPSGPQFADSIVLDGGVTLQLYDTYDESNRFVGPRLRYRRINSDSGFTDTDVMLQPAQHVPR